MCKHGTIKVIWLYSPWIGSHINGRRRKWTRSPGLDVQSHHSSLAKSGGGQWTAQWFKKSPLDDAVFFLKSPNIILLNLKVAQHSRRLSLRVQNLWQSSSLRRKPWPWFTPFKWTNEYWVPAWRCLLPPCDSAEAHCAGPNAFHWATQVSLLSSLGALFMESARRVRVCDVSGPHPAGNQTS